MKQYKTANNLVAELIYHKGLILPYLSPDEENLLTAVSNELTKCAKKLQEATPFERFFMTSTKRKYNQSLKEFTEILEFWGMPRTVAEHKTIIVSYANA